MGGNHISAREFVGREVRQAREAKHLSRGELAKMFPISVSLLGKWETGRRLPTGKNFERLMNFLRIEEGEAAIIDKIIKDLVGNEISPDWFKWPAVEEETGLLWNFQPNLIPGLLQTEEYCRAIQRAANLPTDPEERVDAQMSRQGVLNREDPPKLVALIPESVLRSCVDGPQVMYNQLMHLVSMAERPNIYVHVIPLRSPVYAGFISGFVIANLDGKEVAYVDNQLTGDTVDLTEDVARLHGFFEEFRADALNRQDSINFIRRVAEEWNE